MGALKTDMPMKISLPPGLSTGFQAPPGLGAPVQTPDEHLQNEDIFENDFGLPPGLSSVQPQKIGCPWTNDVAFDNWSWSDAHWVETDWPVARQGREHVNQNTPWDANDWFVAHAPHDGNAAAVAAAHANHTNVWALPTETFVVSPWERKRVGSDDSQETASTADTSAAGEDQQMIVEEVLSMALHASSDERQQALACITHQLQTMLTTQEGSRLVQSAVEVASAPQLDAILAQMKGKVVDVCMSQYGNQVIRKCIDVAGPSRSQLIVDEMRGKAAPLARDRFGCRVIQHLAECFPHSQVSRLMDEVMADAPRHLKHPYANLVVQSLVKSGPCARKAQVAKLLLKDAPGFSRHHTAKDVLEVAKTHCSAADRKKLIEASQR